MFNTFLIVDDQDADQLLAEYAIGDYNPDAKIYKAFDGIEALEVLGKVDDIEIIFLDINMPRMNGHEFLEVYERSDANAPVVVMLTSSDQDIDRERCSKYQFVIDYFSKPIDEEELVKLEEKLPEINKIRSGQ